MATLAPPPKAPSKPSLSATGRTSGADRLIDERIEEAQRALWWAELIRSSLTFVIAGILTLMMWLVVDQWIYSPGMGVRLIVSLSLLAIASWYILRIVLPLLRSSIRPEYAARSLERDMPELRQSLTSYVTLRSDRKDGDLHGRVVRSIGSSTAGKLRNHEELPVEATGTFRWWIATAVAFALLACYVVASPKNSLQSAARLAAPVASIAPARRVTIEDVLPGDVEAIAGRMVSVSATVDGTDDDEDVVCAWDLASGRESIVLSLDPETDRHVGELWIPYSASGSVPYTFTAGDASAGPYRLRVQDLPVVALESVRYEPPQYTGQQPHTSSSGAITALDGTRVQILASTNRPVAKAKIEFNPRVLGDRVRATAGATQMDIAPDGMSLSVSFPLRTAKGRSAAVELDGYRITVADASGQSNPEPIIYPIRVVSDLAPEVSITMPFRSPKDVPIDAQQIIEVHASDPDYGLRQVRLEIRSGIDLIAEPVLWSHPQGKKGNQVTEYRFRPSEHDLQIGATVQMVAIASDNRSSETNDTIEPNVTSTDPVELKITAAAPLPDPEDPNAGGLSAPDERPASDHDEQSGESGGDEGGQGDEQGGGGGGGSGGEGEASESQSGENESGESTSQSGGGESEGEGGGSSGSESDNREGDGNQSDDSSSGNSSNDSSGDNAGEPKGGSGDENNTGENGADNTASDGSPSSDSGTGSDGDPNNQKMNQPNGDSPTGDAESGDSQAGDQNSGESMTPENSGSNSEANESGQNGSGESSGGDNATNPNPNQTTGKNEGDATGPKQSDPQNSDPQNGNNDTGSQESGSDAQGRDPQGGSAAENPSGSDDSSSQSGGSESTGSEGQGQENGAPEHDGEAMERIRDYLEQKQREQEGQGSGSSSDKNEQGQSQSKSGDQESSSGDPSDDQGTGTNENESGDGAKDQDSAGSEGSEESEGQNQSGGNDSSNRDSGEGGEGTSGDKPNPQSSGDGQEGTDESQSGEDLPQGDSSNDKSSEGSAGTDSTKDGGTESNSSESSSSNPNDSAQDGQSQSPSSEPAERGSDQKSTSTPSQSGSGAGDDTGDAAESPIPPDPVNVEYAKKATDMVLDYLKETRESPDQDLLDKLNWSEDDLKRFADRWQKVREMEPAIPGENGELEDALKSLGLRDRSGRTTGIRESGDSLRNIRDSGNRKPPPAAYRDAFDAFRRAMGRQQ